MISEINKIFMFGSQREFGRSSVDTAKKARDILSAHRFSEKQAELTEKRWSGEMYHDMNRQDRSQVDKELQDTLVEEIVTAWKKEGDPRSELDQRVSALRYVHDWMNEGRLTQQQERSQEKAPSYRQEFVGRFGELQSGEGTLEPPSADDEEERAA